LNEQYPDFETYRALYARYYHGRDVGEILQMLDPLQNARVLDLCGGDGRLSLAAIAAGAREVVLVDTSDAMIPPETKDHPQVSIFTYPVDHYLVHAAMHDEVFDGVMCRQGVNYWLDDALTRNVSLVLKPGGVFAFNTFNQRPPENPRVLQYELDGHSFAEVSSLIGDKVHHLQVRDGMKPHYTTFLWLSPERLRELLEPYFVVNEERRGKTSLYRCEKK
jgi:SAM-dependent methyltransferase